MTEPLSAALKLAQTLDLVEPPLDYSLLLLSEALQQTSGIAEAGLGHLDEISEIIASNATGAPQLTDLVHGLFVEHRFAGDVENYHGEENSFLDHVIARRLGMPITLSALVVCVGQRLGLQLNLIGLPGHVVVGKRDSDGRFESFVDSFSGSEVDRPALSDRLSTIFGRTIEVADTMLVPMTTVSVVSRVCNNLTRTWSLEPAKLDRLLELRSHIPQSTTDRRALAEIAEARGRFDIAARMRQAVDPDDPNVDALWGRLN